MSANKQVTIASAGQNWETFQFLVTGMTCAACQSNVQKKVSRLDGVRKADVNLISGTMKADLDLDVVQPQDLIEAVEAIGYGAELVSKEGHEKKSHERSATTVEQQVNTSTGQQEAGQLSRQALDRPVNRAGDLAKEEAQKAKSAFFKSLFWMVPLMYIAMAPMWGLPLPLFLAGPTNVLNFAFCQFLLTLPVLFINQSVFKSGFKGLRQRLPNMDSLIAIGSGASVIYGIYTIFQTGSALGVGDLERAGQLGHRLYFESASMILTIIMLGRYLENRSKSKTTDAITKLIELTPDTAFVKTGDSFVERPVAALKPGDCVQVLTGATIPADGFLLSGFASVDEAALTGESLPVDKETGDRVAAGTINRGGYFTFEVTEAGEDTALSAVIRLVEVASSSKAPVARIADKVAGIFVPVVIGISLLCLIFWSLYSKDFELALNMAISVLVISCPCALGLATPLAIMAGTGAASANGILIRSGEALETARSVDTVVLDKTGTLTAGSPTVADIKPVDGYTAEELLQLAATAEQYSEHVLAKAIVQAAKKEGIKIPAGGHFQATAGQGISCKTEQGLIEAGNMRLVEQHVRRDDVRMTELLAAGERAAQKGETILYFFLEGSYCGHITLADLIKPTSAAAVAALQQAGIRVLMATGDQEQTAATIAAQVGIKEVRANVFPGEKHTLVRSLKEEGRRVAMVGDGINDAPALEEADVGIAIGSGTDIAIEAADIILIKDDLFDVVHALDISRRTIRNIKENLFWALFYNVLCIPLAAGVFYLPFSLQLNPMIGSAAMAFSSIFVVLNALRLTRYRIKPTGPQEQSINVKSIEIEGEEKEQMKTYQLSIEGMMCGHCAAHVEKALAGLPGATDAKVDLAAGQAILKSDRELAEDSLKAAIEEAGYQLLKVEEVA